MNAGRLLDRFECIVCGGEVLVHDGEERDLELTRVVVHGLIRARCPRCGKEYDYLKPAGVDELLCKPLYGISRVN